LPPALPAFIRFRPGITRYYNLASIALGCIALYFAYRFSERLQDVKILPLLAEVGVGKILISAFFYLFSHLLRAFRLVILLNRQDLSLKKIIERQYYTNGINLLIPFRLGEIFRVYAFNRVIQNYQTSVITIITERALDFFFLFTGLILTSFVTNTYHSRLMVPIVIGFFFILSVLYVYYVLPDNLRTLNLYLAKRYNNFTVLRVLATTGKFYGIIRDMKTTLYRKVTTVFVLTAIIWSCELMGFVFVWDYLSFSFIVLLAFLVFLSAFIPSLTLNLVGIQLGFYLVYRIDNHFPWLELSFIYQIFMFAPAILISFGLYLLPFFQKKTVIG
jgi:hypothetical protein